MIDRIMKFMGKMKDNMKDDKKLKGAAGTDWDNSSEVTSIKPGTNITITNDGLGSPVIGVKIPDLAAGVYTSANITISDGGFISKIVSGSSITAGVTSVTQGTSGTIAVTGDDNVNPVLDLTKMQNAGNTFAYPSSITTDDYGRTSVVIAGTAPITNITSTTLDVNNTATPSTIELQTIADVAGDYTSLNATVNAHGIITKASSGGSIPTLNSKYIIAAADTTLPNAENLGALSSGLLMNTVIAGVATLSSAVKGTDYLSGVQEGSGIKLTAGDDPTISIANTTVTAADYTNANLSIGPDGRITAASNGTSGITSITEGSGVTVDNITTPISPIISLKTVGTAGTFTNPSITVNTTGQITNATNGTTPNLTAKYIVQSSDSTLTNSQSLGALTSGLLKNTVTSGTGILSSATAGTDYISGIIQGNGLTVSTGAVPTIGITTITGVANTYAYPSSVVVNNLGQTTSVTAGTAPITSLTSGTGITVAGTTIGLKDVNTNVGPFTNANITVNAQGQITAASNGTTTAGVASVTGTTNNIVVTGTATAPIVNLATVGTGGSVSGTVTYDTFGRITGIIPRGMYVLKSGTNVSLSSILSGVGATGVTSIKITLVGGGGGGASPTSGGSLNGSGGGAGAVVIVFLNNNNFPFTVINCTVGSGGTNGANGGNTTLVSTTSTYTGYNITAGGGSFGTSNAMGQGGTGGVATIAAASYPPSSCITISGGCGGLATNTSGGSQGGVNIFGGAGTGSNGTVQPLPPVPNTGAGGTGSYSGGQGIGTPGASGVIIIEW